MFDRAISSVVALSLALLVWLYARSRDQEVFDNVPIPVTVSLAASQAEHYSLEMTGAAQVHVAFTGPPNRIRELRGMVQRNELRVDLTFTVPEERQNEARFSDTLHVEVRDLHAPPGVSAVMIEGRNHIPVTLHKLSERWLPVHFDPGHDETPGVVLLDPATVLVRGPQEVLDRARFIPTQPSLVPQPSHAALGGVAVGKALLVTELEGRPIRLNRNWVTVRIPMQSRKVYELTDVPVHFLCPANFLLRPEFSNERSGKVTLKVQGPIQEEPPKVYAFIDLTRGRFFSGLNHEPLQIQLPREFSLAEDAPRVIGFELVPADFIPRGLNAMQP
jgi:hypothetical protein